MATDVRLKEDLPALTDEIVETYTTVSSMNHLGHCPLPKYEEVVAAIQDLKNIIYPGYRRREGLHIGNVIGNHVKLYQGITLGALSFPTDANGNLIRKMKRHPTLEDRVVVYANATILGGKTVIGHDTVVGSSVWLTHSVEPHTTVTIETPSLRLRPGSGADIVADANGGLANKESAEHLDLGAWI